MKKYLFIFISLLWGLGRSGAQSKVETPVIIIMADQLRYDAIGDLTPHINSLKEEGITFTRAYCASPLCAPSRAAFFTGLYPNDNGCLINGWESKDEHYREVKSGMPNLYQTMADSWDSHHVGKQHFFTVDKIDEDPNSKTQWITIRDYKQWMKTQGLPTPGGKEFKANTPELVTNEYTHVKAYSIPKYKIYQPGIDYFLDHYIADKSVDVIRNRKQTKPLLLNAMFLAPHPPFDVPEPYYSKIKPADFTLPENVGQWYDCQSPLQMYNLTGFLGTRYSREQWAKIWPKYLGLVNLLDDEVGRIIQALKDEGLYDKALIIFTADHGEMLGSHSLWQKMCMYEESAKVPLIIKFPERFDININQINTPVSLIDIWPTLIDFLKIKNTGETDGISLMPLIEGQNLNRKQFFIQYDGNGAYGNNQRCVVQGDYKLIVDTFEHEVFFELYNVVADPQEKVNLALQTAYEQQTRNMITQIRNYMKNTRDLLEIPVEAYDHFITDYQHMNKTTDE